jgi:hypothetical protein
LFMLIYDLACLVTVISAELQQDPWHSSFGLAAPRSAPHG